MESQQLAITPCPAAGCVVAGTEKSKIAMERDQSRRKFLANVAGVLAAPVILAGCRCSRSRLPDSGSAADELAQDDAQTVAASFRPALPQSEPIVRVRVMKIRRPWTSLVIGVEDQWIRLQEDQPLALTQVLAGPLRLMMESSGWSITDANGFRAGVDGKHAIELESMDDERSLLPLVVEGASGETRQYPGALRLVWRGDLEPATPGAIDVVNQVPLESYLPGVLAGELYRTWQLEMYAAQAVAARSYACTEIAVLAGRRHYDLANTAASQMYLGAVGHERAHQAVAMTRGVVLAHQNLLVSGYYSSCCGGAAACAVDAIGVNPVNDVAPLRGRPSSDVCTEAAVYKWNADQPIDSLSRRLAAYGKSRNRADVASLSTLVSIDVTAVNPHGRPTQMRVVDDAEASAELSAEDFRRAANYAAQGIVAPPKPLRSSYIKAAFDSQTVHFEGNGFGHGVGLCQYGAEALARTGQAHSDILAWYYPQVELSTCYS